MESHLLPEIEASAEDFEVSGDEAWVFILDDSSPEGRRQKPELLGSFERAEGPRIATIDFTKLVNLQAQSEDNAPPKDYLCPISLEVMRQPVIAAGEFPQRIGDPHGLTISSDGFSYELEAIQYWLEGHLRSPMTGLEMANKQLVPNLALKSTIDQWLLLHSPVAL
jgi:hypothetical protein